MLRFMAFSESIMDIHRENATLTAKDVQNVFDDHQLPSQPPAGEVN